MSASLHVKREAGLLRMQAEPKFTERVIPAESFPGVIRMIDALLASSEASVVLAKTWPRADLPFIYLSIYL